ncbi:hypothetical protein THASP1DRAFT_29433, partial [Thamnocephalis sphaerospora]
MRSILCLALVAAAPWMVAGQAITPTARWGHSAALLNNNLYIVGGRSGNNGSTSPLASEHFVLSMDVSQPFDTKFPPWMLVDTPGNKPDPMMDGVVEVDTKNGRLILFGGLGAQTSQSNAVWTLRPTSRSWSSDSNGNGPTPRRGNAGSASVNNDLYVYGGVSSDSSARTDKFNDLYSLDKSSLTWTNHKKATGNNSAPYQHTLSYVPGRKLLVSIGGTGDNNLVPMDQINWYNLEQDVWGTDTARGDIPSPRREHSAVVAGERIIVFGGCNTDYTTFYNDVAVLDTTT